MSKAGVTLEMFCLLRYMRGDLHASIESIDQEVQGMNARSAKALGPPPAAQTLLRRTALLTSLARACVLSPILSSKLVR